MFSLVLYVNMHSALESNYVTAFLLSFVFLFATSVVERQTSSEAVVVGATACVRLVRLVRLV